MALVSPRRARRMASASRAGCVAGDGSGGLADRLGEQGGGVPGGGGWQSSPGASRRMIGVVVDDAAGLVFGDFDEPDPYLLAERPSG